MFLSALPVNAKVLTDSQTGCQITVPDDWKTFIEGKRKRGQAYLEFRTAEIGVLRFTQRRSVKA